MILKGHFIATLALCVLGQAAFAQEDFYALDHLPEINILFTESNWDEILDAYFLAGDEERLTCDLEIDGLLIEGVGIRYKGFSSVSVDRDKNPFNIKLDYSDDSESYQGIDKIKLANVIQDPSFLREVLSYQIAGKYLPSCRANFARLYINGVYWGLYTNVESIDKQFLSDHHWTNTGSLFKCNPETLDLFGENANLSDTPGDDISDYFDLYDLKSDEGWDELWALIQTLNNAPEQIQEVLNVDRTLWMHALNYAIVNLDSYIGYAQNYYLYQDHNGLFNPILWDLNMSFASFRLTDASEYYDGFSIAEAKTIDPLTHLNNVSVFPRPLLRKLLENSTYKRMYLAHLRTIIEENFDTQWYIEQGELHRALIEPWVELDTNKFYGFDDFQANFDSTVSDLVDYPGLTDLMSDRSSYLLEYEGLDNPPAISEISLSPMVFGENLDVVAAVSNAEEAWLFYRFGTDGVFQSLPMLSDGAGNYSGQLQNVGNLLEYYVYAQNSTCGRFAPERAAYEYYSASTALPLGTVVLNEAVTNNAGSAVDNAGDADDDWIELHNLSSTPVSLEGLFLSDDLDLPLKWALPGHHLPAGGYAIVWADEDLEQGQMHSNFKINLAGESLTLFDSTGTLWDATTCPASEPNVAWARFPNGTGPFVQMGPTFAAENTTVSVPECDLKRSRIYPNPAQSQVYFSCPRPLPWRATLFSPTGQVVAAMTGKGEKGSINLNQIPHGWFLLVLEQGNWTETHALEHH